MKFPFFKVLTVAGIVAIAWNCSSDPVVISDEAFNQGAEEIVTPEATNCWLIHGDVTYVIIPGNNGFAVTDTEGNVIGSFDVATATIIDNAGTPIATGIILNEYPVITPQRTIVYPDGKITDMAGTVLVDPNQNQGGEDVNQGSQGGEDVNQGSQGGEDVNQGSQGGEDVNQGGEDQPKSSSSVKSSSSQGGQDQPKSSPSANSASSKEQPKNVGSITIEGNLNQSVDKNASISQVVFKNVSKEPEREWNIYFVTGKYDQNAKTYTLTGTVPDYLSDGTTLSDKYTFSEGSVTFTLTVGKSSQPKSSSSAKSSSSQQQQKSSSSVKSSSSQQQQQQSSSSQGGGQSANVNYKVKNGGRSGQGWGSRYWDCCMPHCAWSGNTGNPTKTCNAQMQSIGESGGSVCSGGQGGVCDSQAPWSVSDNFAFAFAAVPAGLGGECGKCFLLTFDGKSHNGGANANTGGLSGKKMIIMVSNIGGDVGDGQFDIMIPGGGVGAFNGCGNQLGIPSTGAQYGGFITDCKSDPSCVKQKCSAFSKYPKLQAGCEFSATWMGGANNPTFKFEELESCPSEISSKW